MTVKKRGFIIVGIVVLLGLLLLPLLNLMLDRTPDPDLLARVSDPDLRAAMPALMSSCTDCHTLRVRQPIYMKIPPASWLIEDHIRHALSEFNMEQELFNEDGSVSAHALEELTEVLEEGSMPPISYRLLHWDAGLDTGEREALASWIRKAQTRADDDELDDEPESME